jgi:hypothetical protein
MKRKTILFLGIFSIALFRIEAQCAYTYSQNNSPYQNLTASTGINNTVVWDQNSSFNLNLGFSLPLTAGRTCTSVTLGGGSITFNTSSTPYGLFVYHWPFGGNMLTDKGYGTSTSLSPITYEVSGSPGNKIFKIQFSNAGLNYDFQASCTNTTGLDYVNFQFWLYENNGRIEVHFGSNSIGNSQSYHCNFPITAGPHFKFLVDNYLLNLFNNASSPSIQCLSNAGVVYGSPMNGTTANNGTVYIFDPDPAYTITGVPEERLIAAKIYPNPVHDKIIISDSNEIINAPYEIWDGLGKIVLSGSTTGEIDVSDFQSGIYFLKIGTSVSKIVKN